MLPTACRDTHMLASGHASLASLGARAATALWSEDSGSAAVGLDVAGSSSGVPGERQSTMFDSPMPAAPFGAAQSQTTIGDGHLARDVRRAVADDGHWVCSLCADGGCENIPCLQSRKPFTHTTHGSTRKPANGLRGLRLVSTARDKKHALSAACAENGFALRPWQGFTLHIARSDAILLMTLGQLNRRRRPCPRVC